MEADIKLLARRLLFLALLWTSGVRQAAAAMNTFLYCALLNITKRPEEITDYCSAEALWGSASEIKAVYGACAWHCCCASTLTHQRLPCHCVYSSGCKLLVEPSTLHAVPAQSHDGSDHAAAAAAAAALKERRYAKQSPIALGLLSVCSHVQQL